MTPPLDPPAISQIIEMAWDDETSFEAIQQAYQVSEAEVIGLMRRELKPGSFRLWRKRVTGRASKHAKRLRQDQPSAVTLRSIVANAD